VLRKTGEGTRLTAPRTAPRIHLAPLGRPAFLRGHEVGDLGKISHHFNLCLRLGLIRATPRGVCDSDGEPC
jgi:hypothetical protein